MSDTTPEYHLSFRAEEVTLELTASGIDESTWAQITAAVHTELCKPTAIITFPEVLSGTEVAAICQQRIRERI